MRSSHLFFLKHDMLTEVFNYINTAENYINFTRKKWPNRFSGYVDNAAGA